MDLTTLASLAADERNAIVGGPFGSNLVSADYAKRGVPVIRGQNMGHGRWVGGDFVFVSEEKAVSLGSNWARPGDVVFTQRGTLGQVAIVPHGPWNRYVVSQSQMKATLHPDRADPLFIYYYFSDPAERDYILANAIQTGVPHTNLAQLRNHPLRVPGVDGQRAIARVLGALDDKIEQNRRTALTLDQLARAIFRAWFVDFEPVKAKTAGSTSFLGMPEKLFDSLPTRFVDTDIGPVPEGWKVQLIGELARRVAMGPFGSDIKTDNFVPQGVPVIRGGNLTDGFVDGDFVYLTEAKADQLSNANAFPGDIVITHRGTLGQVGLIPGKSRHRRYVVSQSQLLIEPSPELPSHFLYLFLTSSGGQHELLVNKSQTGVPAISRPTTSVKSIRVIAPDKPFLRHFESIASTFYDCRVGIEAESRKLARLRDYLLPRLLDGRVQVEVTNG